MLGGRKADGCEGPFERSDLLTTEIVLSERRRVGGQKADGCEGLFERRYLLTWVVALSKSRRSTRRVNSLLERLFPGTNFGASLASWYDSKYRSGLLAVFSSSVPTSWDRKPHPGDRKFLVNGRYLICHIATESAGVFGRTPLKMSTMQDYGGISGEPPVPPILQTHTAVH